MSRENKTAQQSSREKEQEEQPLSQKSGPPRTQADDYVVEPEDAFMSPKNP